MLEYHRGGKIEHFQHTDEEIEREIQLRYNMFKTAFASSEYQRGGMAALEQLSRRLNLKEPE